MRHSVGIGKSWFVMGVPVPWLMSATYFRAISAPLRGADIMVDGKFIGNAPSIIRVAAGDHILRIEMSGFRDRNYNGRCKYYVERESRSHTLSTQSQLASRNAADNAH